MSVLGDAGLGKIDAFVVMLAVRGAILEQRRDNNQLDRCILYQRLEVIVALAIIEVRRESVRQVACQTDWRPDFESSSLLLQFRVHASSSGDDPPDPVFVCLGPRRDIRV